MGEDFNLAEWPLLANQKRGASLSVAKLSLFSSANNSGDFRPKLANPVDSCSYEYLSNGCLIPPNLPLRIPWFPSSCDRRRRKCTKVRHDLRAKRLLVAIVGNKVAYDCMFCPRPEPIAVAPVVTRLPPQ